jgi:predicted Zn-dependent peptidase
MNPIKKVKKEKKAPVQVSIQQTSSADELKKYKELLDQGIITQEEFDAKKKQLLGL